MKLLAFAHKGEANCFIKYFKAKPYKNECFLSAWEYEQGWILLTGEGLIDSAIALSSFLATHHIRIKQLTNIGIAGILRPPHVVHQVVEVRTVYGAQDPVQPYFHSYSTSYPHPKIDCISVSTRVKNRADAELYGIYADIVDRELWSLAKTAKIFKLPWNSIKYLSDDVSKNSLDCKNIQESAELYSLKLLEFYLLNTPITDHCRKTETLPKYFDNFYMTHSQRQKLIKTIKSLKIKLDANDNTIQKLIEDDRALQQKILKYTKKGQISKNGSKELIQYLHHKLNPVQKFTENYYEI